MTYCLGIDLGTSFTAAATARQGRAEMVELGERRPQIPTVVHISASGEVVVGDAAERRSLSDPDGIAREFKRRLGDQVGTVIRSQLWSAESLMAAVVDHVVTVATERQNGPPAAVALSHPANWGPYKLDLLREVARLAKLDNVVFVAEPVAAALHARASGRLGDGRCVAVYDLGGGTFDVSLVRTGEISDVHPDGAGIVLGRPDGLERLGGIDFDEALRQLVEQLLNVRFTSLDTSDAATMRGLTQLRTDLVTAKEALSVETRVEVPLFLPGLPTSVRVTRAEFEAAIAARVSDTMSVTERAIESAGLDTADLGGLTVLLVGGSSRMPLVGRLVAEQLKLPTAVDEHPKHPVALGAAHWAALSSCGASEGEAAVVEAVLTGAEPDGREPAGSTVLPAGAWSAATAPWYRRRAAMAIAGSAAAVLLAGGLALKLGGRSSATPGPNGDRLEASSASVTGGSRERTTTTAPSTVEPPASSAAATPSAVGADGATAAVGGEGATAAAASGSGGASAIVASAVVASANQSTAGSPSATPSAGAAEVPGAVAGIPQSAPPAQGAAGAPAPAPAAAPLPAVSPQPDAQPAPVVPTASTLANALGVGSYEEQRAVYSEGWQTCSGRLGQSGGCDMWTSTPGRSYTITFRGTGIVIYGAKAFNGGQMEFSVDGAHRARADSYFDGNSSRRLDVAEYYRVTGLPHGDHQLTATMAPERNAANTQPTVYVTLDKFDVIG